ncbi:MAG: translation initiation factor IF-2 [Acidobacteria bacterium]|nr:translation initiation factor IF-2 [Acidobacteriota bacterium]
MATVRIYKVAELLNTTSQDVVALLKRDHGIDVKSASSTIEEVVARQFVERVASERGLSVPSATFTSKPKVRRRKTAKSSAQKVEPKKPAAKPLPPPRLVKAKLKPPVDEVEEPKAEDSEAIEPQPTATLITAKAPAPLSEKPVELESPRTSRVVPPTLRLRVEDGGTPSEAKVAAPAKPEKRQVTTTPPAQPITRPVNPKGSPRVTVAPSRAPIAGPRPPAQPARPAALPQRPGGLPPRRGRRPPFRPGGRSGKRKHPRAATAVVETPLPDITRTITLAEGMTVKDLADKLDTRAKDVLKKLIEKRIMMTINTTLDTDTATMIAREFGADVEMRTFEEEMLHVEQEDAQPEDLFPRAPVVTVMGHVDHGKTTLLDGIRETRVAEREAGGITQHIGAYTVDVKDKRIVFLDTPGHAAFTLMRARGAKVTDVVVLVVAADDGVMPQTKEAVDHARAANAPIIVAVNKIDKSDANPDRVKTELSDLDLTPEAWGGKTVTVDVSAKKRENIDLLLEMILLVADLGELKANPKRNAAGTVLEAKLDRGRGPVATILVQDGTLRVGDTFIAGTVVGKVRALINDQGQKVESATPSTPVEVLGLGGLPQPGDAFQALPDASKARQIANLRQTQAKERELGSKSPRLTLESLQEQVAEGNVKELSIVIKADVQGSAEVLADTLAKLSDEQVKIRIIHSGVGAINESDALLASASNAIVIGFNVRPDRNANAVAERDGLDMRMHSVIYHVTDEIKKAMAGLLEPTKKEVRLGAAEVRETFKVPKFGFVAGCMVTEGLITRSGDAHARLLRDNIVVHEGRIGSLRRFKDDVNEVKTGLECGIAFERFKDVKVGDVIEAFTVEEVAATV